MNESTCSSAFQTKMRQALPDCVLIKHADKSMIGCLDASLTYKGRTLWMEYKFIGPKTKGVTAEFMRSGLYSPLDVAAASPVQFEMAKRLAKAGHCLYLFWVMDYKAPRKRISHVRFWHPVSDCTGLVASTDLVASIIEHILNL